MLIFATIEGSVVQGQSRKKSHFLQQGALLTLTRLAAARRPLPSRERGKCRIAAALPLPRAGEGRGEGGLSEGGASHPHPARLRSPPSPVEGEGEAPSVVCSGDGGACRSELAGLHENGDDGLFAQRLQASNRYRPSTRT